VVFAAVLVAVCHHYRHSPPVAILRERLRLPACLFADDVLRTFAALALYLALPSAATLPCFPTRCICRSCEWLVILPDGRTFRLRCRGAVSTVCATGCATPGYAAELLFSIRTVHAYGRWFTETCTRAAATFDNTADGHDACRERVLSLLYAATCMRSNNAGALSPPRVVPHGITAVVRCAHLLLLFAYRA
jgi:hypothetical protein